jgi:hypothetical protein
VNLEADDDVPAERPGIKVPLEASSLSYDSMSHTLTITFQTPLSGVEPWLRNGYYELSLGPGITDASGLTLSGNRVLNFHRLRGDFDGNKWVGNGDWSLFSASGRYSSEPGDPMWDPGYDLDENNHIGFGDFSIFSVLYNNHIIPPSGGSGASAGELTVSAESTGSTELTAAGEELGKEPVTAGDAEAADFGTVSSGNKESVARSSGPGDILAEYARSGLFGTRDRGWRTSGGLSDETDKGSESSGTPAPGFARPAGSFLERGSESGGETGRFPVEDEIPSAVELAARSLETTGRVIPIDEELIEAISGETPAEPL